MSLGVLALLWAAWCALHSALISSVAAAWGRRLLGPAFRFWRLGYTAVSAVTLVPLHLLTRSLPSPEVFRWEGQLRIAQWFLVGAGLVLFLGGARRYDLPRFLGLRQLEEGPAGGGIARGGRLEEEGILGVVRHPWYAGGLLWLWARPLRATDLTVSLVLSAYLVLGARLEERRLLREFGEPYREYRRRVSMFFPIKWIRKRLR